MKIFLLLIALASSALAFSELISAWNSGSLCSEERSGSLVAQSRLRKPASFERVSKAMDSCLRPSSAYAHAAL